MRQSHDDATELLHLPREPEPGPAVPLVLPLEADLSPQLVDTDPRVSGRFAPAADGLMGVLKLSIAVLLVLLALTQWVLWQPGGSLQQYWQMAAAVQHRVAENQRLSERNQALAAEVLDLKQGLEAVEELARAELGLVKQDETFFQVLAPTAHERKRGD